VGADQARPDIGTPCPNCGRPRDAIDTQGRTCWDCLAGPLVCHWCGYGGLLCIEVVRPGEEPGEERGHGES